MGDDKKPWVTMTHPDVEGDGIASREAFDSTWSEKGWQITDEHDIVPTAAADVIEPEKNEAGEAVDPQRLTKVLDGAAKPEDVGVDPSVLEPPVEPEAPAPAQPEPPAAPAAPVEPDVVTAPETGV